MSTEQSATPPMSEPVAPKWTVTLWRDRNGRQWQAKKNGRWYSPYGELFIDGYADALVDSLDELRAVHGPLTPLAVDNVPALLADESRYRQLWAAQVRDRQSKPRDPAKDAAESALWETFRGVVRRAEAERNALAAALDARNMSADLLSAELEDARRELATVAEQIATAIEAKRGTAQPARYVAALTKAADIARSFAVQSGSGSEPTDRFRLAEWDELPDECFVDGCDATETDQRGPVWIRGGLMRKACTEHWEPIMRVLGEQVSWQKTDAMRAIPATGLPEQDSAAEPPESLLTGGDEIGSPDTWSTATSITEEQQ